MKKKQECKDSKCPFHGNVKTRGRTFTGNVISDKMSKTVIVEWYKKKFIPKYERYEIKRKKVNAHNPECINAVKGNKIKIIECRPLSKTKKFVVIEKL